MESYKENLICGFKYDMKNLMNFHATTQKPENFFSMGSFFFKIYKVWTTKIQSSYL